MNKKVIALYLAELPRLRLCGTILNYTNKEKTMSYATLHNTAPPQKNSQVLENPITGERITFLVTSNETEGRLHQHRLELPPHSSTPKQLHPHQQKSLQVITGELRVWVNGLEHLLSPGEDVVILPGQAHTWKSDSETSVVVTMRPALNSSELLTTQVALAKEGKTDKHGTPTTFHHTAFARAFKNEIVFVQSPIQQALHFIFATLNILLSYKTFHKQDDTPFIKRTRRMAP
jgi:quercetin dioxygenase-like cupin family protein